MISLLFWMFQPEVRGLPPLPPASPWVHYARGYVLKNGEWHLAQVWRDSAGRVAKALEAANLPYFEDHNRGAAFFSTLAIAHESARRVLALDAQANHYEITIAE